MPDCTRSKIERLLNRYFRWGRPGYPSPPVPDTPAAREESAKEWIREQVIPFRSTALALIARVKAVIQEIEADVRTQEKPRLLARIDTEALVKSPESILEKLVREWDGYQNLPFDFSNLGELGDVARFRIVANFLSDADAIAKAIEAPYGPTTANLTPAQRFLNDEYLLFRNRLEDSIHVLPEKRSKGERCRKGVFHPREAHLSHLKIEVQVQTLLQEAWDKKDHFLLYEPKRRGENIDPRHTMEMFAMSELLYVADLTFDRLKKEMLGSSQD